MRKEFGGHAEKPADVSRGRRRRTASRTPEWKALAAHYAEIRRRHLRDAVRRRPRPRRARSRAEAGDLYLDYSKHRVTDETLGAAARARRRAPACAERTRRDVRAASTSTSPRTARCCTSRCGCRGTRSLVVDGVDVVAEVHEVLDRMGAFCRPGPRRRVDRAHRQARSAPSSTSASAAPTSARRWPTRRCATTRDRDIDVPVRVERRRRPTSPRRTRDLDPAETLFVVSSKTFTTLETLTNAAAPATGWLAGRCGEDARSPTTSSPCRRTPRACRDVRHRHRQHVRVLGLGRRPLLVGLGDRPVADGRDRPRALRARCSPASTRSTSTSARAPFDRNLPVLLGLIGVWYGKQYGELVEADQT